jgi:hypothetical protein
MLLAFLLACGGDIGIRAVDKAQEDTSEIIDVPQPSTEPSDEPSTEPSSEPSTEPLNGTVGITRYTLEQLACPACMGASQEINVLFETKLHNKISEEHPLWFPPMGQCTTNTNPIEISVSPINVGQSLSIQGSMNSFTAYNNGVGLYSSYLQEWQYDRDTNMTVNMQDNTSYSFRSIQGFDEIQPLELRYVDPSYAFAAVVSKFGTTFSWLPAGVSDEFNVMIAAYSPDGSQLLGVISCTVPDTGFMNFDGSYFQSYPTWSLAAIYLTRISKQRVPYEALGGYVDVQLEWTVVGTGHIE